MVSGESWSWSMIDCIVCRYWSERLEKAKAHRRGKGARNEEKCLIASLRRHQRGACACTFPDLLKDLVKHEREQADKIPSVCDPVRVRILAATLYDKIAQESAYGWQ